jgi:MFS superfamily sulfate permease-like transporter
MLDYSLSEAVKLATGIGVISGLLFAAVMSAVLLLLRRARAVQFAKKNPESTIMHEEENGAIDKKFILLMDKEMSFNVLIQSIIDQALGEVGKGDKKKGTITVYTPEHSIDIAVEKLTKHTSEVNIRSNVYDDYVKAIINYTKTKEHSFLQY